MEKRTKNTPRKLTKIKEGCGKTKPNEQAGKLLEKCTKCKIIARTDSKLNIWDNKG